VDRLPVHELSAVNDHSLRFKYSATSVAQGPNQSPTLDDMHAALVAIVRFSNSSRQILWSVAIRRRVENTKGHL
jgi:hypothetical protein